MTRALINLRDAVLRALLPDHGPVQQVAAIYALSDAELEARGMKRRDAALQIMRNGDWS